MTPFETIFGGIVIGILSGSVGKYIGAKDKVADKLCKERQQSCSTHVSEQLTHIKTEQSEMKVDIKELLKRVSSIGVVI